MYVTHLCAVTVKRPLLLVTAKLRGRPASDSDCGSPTCSRWDKLGVSTISATTHTFTHAFKAVIWGTCQTNWILLQWASPQTMDIALSRTRSQTCSDVISVPAACWACYDKDCNVQVRPYIDPLFFVSWFSSSYIHQRIVLEQFMCVPVVWSLSRDVIFRICVFLFDVILAFLFVWRSIQNAGCVVISSAVAPEVPRATSSRWHMVGVIASYQVD